MRPVINALMLDYPTMHIDQARAIYQYASEACAAAAQISQLGIDYVHKAHEVPHITE